MRFELRFGLISPLVESGPLFRHCLWIEISCHLTWPCGLGLLCLSDLCFLFQADDAIPAWSFATATLDVVQCRRCVRAFAALAAANPMPSCSQMKGMGYVPCQGASPDVGQASGDRLRDSDCFGCVGGVHSRGFWGVPARSHGPSLSSCDLVGGGPYVPLPPDVLSSPGRPDAPLSEGLQPVSWTPPFPFDGHVMRNLLQLLNMLDSFLRSLALLQLLAFCRVLAFAVPLHKRRKRCNRVVSVARQGLRGAPLCLALANCLPFAAAVTAGAGQHTLGTRLEAGRASYASSLAAREDLCADPDSPVFSRVRTVGWKVPVVVLQYQRLPLTVSLHTAAVQDAADLTELATDLCEAEDHALQLCHVEPQPACNYPVLLAAPFQASTMGRVPVCVCLVDNYAGARIWLEFFDSPLCLSDVQHALGSDWKTDARVFVHALGRPLDEDGQHITAGTLVQVVPATRPPLRLSTLDVKLERPDLHLRRLDRDGFLADTDGCSGHCLLQPLEPPHIFHYSPPLAGPPQFESVALSHASQQLGPSRLLWPAHPIRDLNVRERLTGSVCGAFPRHITSRAPVFVDSRSICFSYQLRASYTGCMPLAAFLTRVGLSVPDQHLLEVSGTALFHPATRRITVSSGDTVVLRYRPLAEDRIPLGPAYMQSVDLDSEGSAARERSARRSTGAARGAGSASSSSGRPAGTALRSGHAGPSSVGNPMTHLHELWRLIGNRAFLLDPAAAACRYASLLGFRCQLRDSLARQPVVVYQEADQQPGVFGAEGPATDDQNDTSSSSTSAPQDFDSPAALPGSPLPELLCVHATVTFFQGVTEQHTLWIEAGESVDSVLVRAQILLNPDPGFATLAFVDPQPDLPRLSFIRFPTWWHDAGIRAFLVIGPDTDASPFVQTTQPHQLAGDMLPHPALPEGAQCSVHAPAATNREEVVLQPDVPVPDAVSSASLLHVRLPSTSQAAFRTPQQQLASLEHTAASDIRRGTIPERQHLLTVFLAHASDHMLLQLDYGSVQQQFAAAFQVPRAHMYLQRQRHTFDQLVIAGKRPSACFGYRNIHDLGRPFQGKGLFLDSRPVGHSVSFWEVRNDVLTARVLCIWLQVEVPVGYAPCCTGGTSPHGPQGGFTFESGDTVLLWLDCIVPSRAPSDEPGSADDEGTESGDAPGSPDSPGFPPGGRRHNGPSSHVDRSRSPRRCHSGSGLPHAACRAESCGSPSLHPHQPDMLRIGASRRVAFGGCRPVPSVAGDLNQVVSVDCQPCGPLAPRLSCSDMWSSGVFQSAALAECPPSFTPIGHDGLLDTSITKALLLSSPADPRPHGVSSCLPGRIPTPCRSEAHVPHMGRPTLPSLEHGCGVAADGSGAPERGEAHGPVSICECVFFAAAPGSTEAEYLQGTAFDVGSSLRTLLEDSLPVEMDAILSRAVQVLSARRTLSLESSIAMTPHQQSVLGLRELLPAVPDPGTYPCDWLDADIGHVLHRSDVKPHLRAAFQSLTSYWTLPAPCMPVAVHVYTDGTATTDPAQFERFAHQCAWSFCVWLSMPDGQDYFYGHAVHSSVSPMSPYHAGEVEEDALTAEQLAFFWCLTWVVDTAPAFRAPVVVHSDCQTAARGAFGQAQPASTGKPVGRPLHEAVSILRHGASCVVPLTYQHVSSHTGVVGNELCDTLAKIARETWESETSRCLPMWSCRLVRHPLAVWSWTMFSTLPDMPSLYAFEAEAFRLQTHPAPPLPPPPPVAATAPARRRAEAFLELRLLSFNVLSLLDAKDGLPDTVGPGQGLRVIGKREVLKRQLMALQVHLTGLQETRLPDTAVCPDADFFMFQAGATANSRLGVALWASKHVAYAWEGDRPYYFSLDYFTMLDFSPRHIVLRVSAPYLRLQVVVAHAPHERCETDSAFSFWSRVFASLDYGIGADPIVLLADTNGHFGSVHTCAVGELAPEEENEPARVLHEWLLTARLFLPSTFPACHSGETKTWRSPQGTYRRLDFIALPEEWRLAAFSRTILDFESLHEHEDHRPVLATCSFVRELTDAPYQDTARRCVLRPTSEHDPGELQVLQHLVTQAPPVPWHWTSDHHYEAWVQTWVNAWRDAITRPAVAPRQTFLTTSTLEALAAKKAYKVYLLAEEKELETRRLKIAFAALYWNRHGATPHAEVVSLARRIARAVYGLQQSHRALKSGVRTDRRAYLESLASAVHLSDHRNPKALFASVRRAFPAARSAKRSAFRPLPRVNLRDGSPALDQQARTDRWLEHFAAQEAGEVVDPATYVQQVSRQQTYGDRHGPCCLPDLGVVERLILRASKGRAAGPDAVTAELLQLQTPATARSLLPLYLKSCLSLAEPVHWKGGHLICLAKRVGAAFNCDAFRSVMVSSVPGKMLHRFWRTGMLEALRTVASPLQAGAFPGVSIEALSLYASAFRGAAAACSSVTAMLYYDVQEAFYRALRQVVAPFHESDEAYVRLMSSLGLPPCAAGAFYQTLPAL